MTKTSSKKLTQSEYARHRGISRQHVSRLIQLGVIVLESDGRINRAKADLAVEQVPEKGEGFFAARTRKETALANLRELELKIKAGKLLDRDSVRRAAFEAGKATRDAILLIPHRLSGTLAALSDQTHVHEVLTKELTLALSTLADSHQPDPPTLR